MGDFNLQAGQVRGRAGYVAFVVLIGQAWFSVYRAGNGFGTVLSILALSFRCPLTDGRFQCATK
jgi:hypothetical protein